MENINPAKIRYIKLGAGGRWEGALDRGTLEWGDAGDSHVDDLGGDWDTVNAGYVANGRLKATATGLTTEARAFYGADATVMWITFARGRMWWTFAGGEVRKSAEGSEATGSLSRPTLGGWRDRDVNGLLLDTDRLSTGLTQLGSYQRTICQLSPDQDALCRRYINAELDPFQAAVVAARDDLRRNLLHLIKKLSWQDFEQFVDLALARLGWVRVSALGGTTKDVDLIVEQPFTRERMAVQIKSAATQSTVDDYARRLVERSMGERLCFVCHSPIGDLTVPRSEDGQQLQLILGENVAELAMNAGLVDWVSSHAH